MDAQEFITKKYEHNNWGIYPPSRRLVGEWLEEFAKKYHTEQLRLGAVMNYTPYYGREGELIEKRCDDCGKDLD